MVSQVAECYLKALVLKDTKDHNGVFNGNILEVWNVLEPSQEMEIRNVYITRCLPRSSKGPHLHQPPKVDRFLCVEGDAKVTTRNEHTGRIHEWHLVPLKSLLIIPPLNSHKIESIGGCHVLNLCSELYDPSKPYNQTEVIW